MVGVVAPVEAVLVRDRLDARLLLGARRTVRGEVAVGHGLCGTVQLAPGIAANWEADPSGNIFTFTLREGLRFHDGTPLTSADVVYSLTRHKDPATASKARALALQMEEIKATPESPLVTQRFFEIDRFRVLNWQHT